jgi:hypothetical protein
VGAEAHQGIRAWNFLKLLVHVPIIHRRPSRRSLPWASPGRHAASSSRENAGAGHRSNAPCPRSIRRSSSGSLTAPSCTCRPADTRRGRGAFETIMTAVLLEHEKRLRGMLDRPARRATEVLKPQDGYFAEYVESAMEPKGQGDFPSEAASNASLLRTSSPIPKLSHRCLTPNPAGAR